MNESIWPRQDHITFQSGLIAVRFPIQPDQEDETPAEDEAAFEGAADEVGILEPDAAALEGAGAALAEDGASLEDPPEPAASL